MVRFVLVLLIAFLLSSTISPSTQAAEPDFSIRSGDVLQVTVWKEDGLDHEIVVLPDGTITFPLAGTIPVAGLTPKAAQDMIKEKLNNTIPDASVSVVVKAPLGHTVNVVGQVTKPGEIIMTQRMSVMQALSQAGGLSAFASTDDIKILRQVDGKETAIPFPYDDITDGDNLDKNISLMPGDVIVVPTAGLF
ncbi:MAG TPA: sugar transporter [Rhodospirillaceae bacterium]|nr:sugar transporter [Rhodospirillaceae bacterium]